MLRWIAALLLCANILTAPVAAQDRLDDAPRVAVISAFAPELRQLLAKAQVEKVHSVNGVEFHTATLGGRPAVLFLSGISMVNAAMTTQLALDRFNVTHLVFSGIAGGVDPELNIGDVVVAERWGQYLEGILARETPAGFAPPPWAGKPFPNYGPHFPQPVKVRRAGAAEEAKFWFDVDADMLAKARTVAGRAQLARCGAQSACLTAAPKVVVGGNGVSGQSFVDNAAFRDYTYRTFGAKVLDMETAAVAHVAYANAVPYIAFRSLSDLAGGGPGENEMTTFLGLAADNSAGVVVAFLEALGR